MSTRKSNCITTASLQVRLHFILTILLDLQISLQNAINSSQQRITRGKKLTVKTLHTISLIYLFTVSDGFAQDNKTPGSTPSAQAAFAAYSSSIYQVRIINIKSQNLNSSGSGFFADNGFYFVTNYHVISSVLLEPEEYKAIIEIGEDELELKVVAIDIVNDLALLSSPSQHQALNLRDAPPEQGEKLFSICNPHNLGMTIVEGNYNGLAEDYIFDRIHFSGAINPGMSGGPTIDGEGKVVGVNVQTGGNQLGFLVPVEKLSFLLERYKNAEAVPKEVNKAEKNLTEENDEYAHLRKSIGEQIASTTSTIIDSIIEKEHWPNEELGELSVTGKLHPGFSCWGSSKKNKKKHLSRIRKGCDSRQFIYISPRLNSGHFSYEFELLVGKDWPTDAFYRYISRVMSNDRAPNRVTEKDVENFDCLSDVLSQSKEHPKRTVAYCSRSYKEFPELHDTFYTAVTIDKEKQVLMERFWLTGVSTELSQAFLKKFIEQRASPL